MFERTLEASRNGNGLKRKLEVLPLVVGLHALALGVVVAAQLWAVPPVPEPVLWVGIGDGAPKPPPTDGGSSTGRKPRDQQTRRSHAARPRIVQPHAVPDQPARPGAPEQRSGPEPVPGTLPGIGEPDGPGGDDEVDDPGDGVGVAPEPEVIHVVGGRVTAPEAIFHPAPAYPEAARRMRLQGTVIVQATIDSSGNVVDAKWTHPIGMGCEEAAVEAIRRWRYRPATLEGRPVSVYLTVTVTFQLRGGE